MSRALSRLTTTAATGLLTLALTAGPALADDLVGPREGAEPGAGLSPAQTALLYAVIPLGVILLIAATVLLPGSVRTNRYRPAKGWAADAVWVSGPVDAAAAIEAADRGDMQRGGARGSW